MFGIFKDVLKVTAGLVVETPLAVVADVITLGGSLTDTDKPYTATALEKVMDNIDDATSPFKKGK